MLVINAADFVEIAARDLPMATGKSGALGGFTDTEISGAKVKHGEERELTKWEGGEGGEENPSLTLDAPGTEWDQFATNEEKFGVTTTYNERMYTTDLNKSTLTPAQIARAEQMAREIEGDTSMTDNIHVREDRGMETEQDKGMDEEDRHSSVLTKDLSQRHESQEAEKKEPAKKPFKLNPNSKPFEFNPGAAAFQPGGMAFAVRALTFVRLAARADRAPAATQPQPTMPGQMAFGGMPPNPYVMAPGGGFGMSAGYQPAAMPGSYPGAPRMAMPGYMGPQPGMPGFGQPGMMMRPGMPGQMPYLLQSIL